MIACPLDLGLASTLALTFGSLGLSFLGLLAPLRLLLRQAGRLLVLLLLLLVFRAHAIVEHSKFAEALGIRRSVGRARESRLRTGQAVRTDSNTSVSPRTKP
jgi:hypothetical protein